MHADDEECSGDGSTSRSELLYIYSCCFDSLMSSVYFSDVRLLPRLSRWLR